MYSYIFRKGLYQTINIQNFEKDNRECIFFSVRFCVEQYIFKILKKIVENVLIYFPTDSLSNNTYPEFLRR